MWNPELSTCQWTFKRSSPQPTRPLKNLSLDIFNLICSTATKARSKILYYGLSSTRGKIILFCQLFPLVKKFYFCALTDFFFQFLSGNCTPIATFCSLSVPPLNEENIWVHSRRSKGEGETEDHLEKDCWKRERQGGVEELECCQVGGERQGRLGGQCDGLMRPLVQRVMIIMTTFYRTA